MSLLIIRTKAQPALSLSIIRIVIALACVGLCPSAQAVDPPPDGGYPIGNTAEGEDALFSLTTGYDNVAVGYQALYSNTSGILNTATGYRALAANATGTRNTATGNAALSRNTTGISNTATGLHAMFLNTVGQRNTGEGAFALGANTTGSYNIALGYNAGSSLTTGNDNIDIGNVGMAGESGTLRIGTAGKQNVAYVAGVYGAMEASGVNVIVGPDGHLGTVASSGRFKAAIEPMDKASEAILGLRPVRFRYKHELDPNGIPQFGLIAEEVAKVDPALVACDAEGKVYSVRYEAINAMLLNEFLKEHRQFEQQRADFTEMKSIVAKQNAIIARQERQIETLTATVQRVSEQATLGKSASQLVANP